LFDKLTDKEVRALLNEALMTDIDEMPAKDTRKYYLLEFIHWLLGEILSDKLDGKIFL
jgi:hypothetical protein